jgi:hypothetical protein
MKISIFLLTAFFIVFPSLSQARQVDFGITDTGEARHFEREVRRVNFRFPVVQTFHPWGNSLNQAIPRWKKIRVTPYLHISTADDETRKELISPWGISQGRGDRYLLELNQQLGDYGLPAVVRPLGEPNRVWNPYCAFRPDGSRRDWRHQTKFYRKAFRRIFIILHGGPRKQINKKLQILSLPILQESAPAILATPPVKIFWSPLPGSASIKGNGPSDYWPGRSFVDMVGTSFYSKWPYWKDLNRFFRTYSSPSRPFALAEWGLLSDDPDFSRRVIRWCINRCQSMFYYQGFGFEEGYKLSLFPNSLEVIKKEVSRPIFRQSS